MSRSAANRRRLPWLASGLACLAASGAGIALGGPARADSAPGSSLGSFALTATAPGMQLTWDYPTAATHPIGEGDVPHSLAQLQSGPQGYALSSVAWPGSLAGNAGSTSQLLGLGIPPSVSGNLNDPIRAEARTGNGPSSVTNDSVPGTDMTASATDTEVRAQSTIAGAVGPVPGMSTGNTVTTSDTRLTGVSTALATASSRVQDIVLAGGVVKIASVTSTADVATDGVHASGHGGTVVAGMTIAGQPVSVDQSGVHVGQAGAPANAAASAIVNQALAGAGMKILVSMPSDRAQGASDTYDAGNVVFTWNVPNSQGQTGTATFGGASATVAAAPGIAALDVSGTPGAGGATAPLPSPSGASAPLPATGLDGGVPAAQAPSAAATPRQVVAAGAVGLPGGLSPLWLALALVGSLLCAGGLRRLPDRVLEHPATACTLGDPT